MLGGVPPASSRITRPRRRRRRAGARVARRTADVWIPMSGGSSAYQPGSPGDRVEPVGVVRSAPGGDVGDAHGHRGVVAPLAGRDTTEAAAEHLAGSPVSWRANSYGTPSASPAAWPSSTPSAPTLRVIQYQRHSRYC